MAVKIKIPVEKFALPSLRPGRRSRLTIAAALSLFSAAIAGAQQESSDNQDKPKIRYKIPALMMVTWAEWPKEPAQQDVMAQFILSHGFNAVEVEVDMLAMCRRNGLYARLGAGDINELLKEAAKLKDDKSVFAYFISDRRRRNSFPGFANIARAFEKADPNHPTIFINRAIWGEYHEFVKQANPMILDFYHYHWDGRRHPERRYIYLRSFCELGQQKGIPVMRCVGAGVPIGQLRQTMFTSLAYGVQAFHFWPPWTFSYEKEGELPVLKDGKIVPRVNVPPLAEVAREIAPLGPALAGLRSTGVYHTKPFHPEAPGAASIPEDSWVQASGEHLILGLFEDEEKNDYLMVVNADAGSEREAKLSMDPRIASLSQLDKKTGKWADVLLEEAKENPTISLKLAPGSGELFKVTREKK